MRFSVVMAAAAGIGLAGSLALGVHARGGNEGNSSESSESRIRKAFEIRTGHDPDGPPGSILQVMPWPILRNMTREDLDSIYEYLKSIPHAEPGQCAGAGQ